MKKAAANSQLVRKTYITTEVLTDIEAKKLFEAATKTFQCTIKGTVNEERTMYLKISTSDEDRSHDRVNPKGMIADNFINNPVVSGFHEYSKPSVGRALQLAIGDGYVISKMEFPPEGINPDADILHGLYKAGFQHAASIGFIPVKSTPNDIGGRDFEEWEIIEYALVLVPDNPKALQMMYEKGFNPETFEEDFGKAEEEQKDAPGEKEDKPTEEPKEPQQDNTADTPAKTVESSTTPETTPVEITDATPVKDLTLGHLKGLFAPSETEVDAEKKDVSQVTSLAYVLSDLQWIAYMFEYDEVSQSTIDKINQAISLILDAIKEQAELGKKEIAISTESFETFTAEQKEQVRATLTKAGRTISAKHEQLLKEASEHIQTVLDSVATQDTPEETEEEKAVPEEDFFTKFANQLKTNNQQQAAILRNQKEQKAAQDTTLTYLEQLASGIGGEQQTNK